MLTQIIALNDSLLSFKSDLQEKIIRQKNFFSGNARLTNYFFGPNEDKNLPPEDILYHKIEDILLQLDCINTLLDNVILARV